MRICENLVFYLAAQQRLLHRNGSPRQIADFLVTAVC
jgi:hypothetical protein